MAVSMALRDPRISSANFWNSLPEAVIETLPPERSSSLAPTSSSRERIWDEIAGWVRKRFSAAREKEGAGQLRETFLAVQSPWELLAFSFQHSALRTQHSA